MSLHTARNTKTTYASTAQPYGNVVSIITPILTLTFIIYLVSFQLLHFSFVKAATITQPVVLAGTLSSLLDNSHMLKAADPQQHITLSIGLRPHNDMALQQTIQDLFSNQRAQRQHFIPTAQYVKQFSPDAKLYTRLGHYLTQAGFTIIHTYTHRLLLDFNGTIAQAEQLFHTHINIYATPDGHVYFSNNSAPLLPHWLAGQVISLNGLSNTTHWEHTHVQTQSAANNMQNRHRTSNPCPRADNNTNSYNLNSLYQAHYHGEEQSIALFELSSLHPYDLANYTTCFGQDKTTIETIATGSSPAIQDTAIGNVEADAELLLGALPQLSTLKIYTTGNNETDYLAQWAQIIQDATPVVTTNWGLCEQQVPSQVIQQEYYFFQLAALQGQNIFTSPGNNGSASCPVIHGHTPTSVTEVMDPAAQPFVTAVGETTLQHKGIPNDHKMVWHTSPGDHFSEDSGGGLSQYWSMPAWQHMSGVPDATYSSARPCSTITHTASYCREVPDVSLNVDPKNGSWIYCSVAPQCDPTHPWIRIADTTIATSFWAALLTLTNEMSQQQGGTNLGFITPLLYQVANDPVKYASSFHDVITDNSDDTHVNAGRYPATVGYDMATGLGSYQAWPLAQNLILQAIPPRTTHNRIDPITWNHSGQ